jgi:anti-sigma factor RsiW
MHTQGCPEWETALLETAWGADDLAPAIGFAAHLADCQSCRDALEAERTLASRAREAAPVTVPGNVTDGLAREVFQRTTRHDAERRHWLHNLLGTTTLANRAGWAAALTATAAGLIAVTMPTSQPDPAEMAETSIWSCSKSWTWLKTSNCWSCSSCLRR